MIRHHARWVVPVEAPPIADGTVVVDGDTIVWVGPRDAAPPGDDHDLGDAVLLPGLVNAHTHLELTAMRGFLEGLGFVEWIRTLTRARAAVLSDDRMLDAARVGIAEGLAAGITTYADTSSSGAPFHAMREMGVRGVMYQEVFGPAPAQREASLATLRAQVERLLPLRTALVRVGVSPHAPYTVHEDLLVDACAYGLAEGLPVAMHVCESREETRFLREGEGQFADGLRARGIAVGRRAHSAVHLLAELGVAATVRPLLIHGAAFDESDVALAAHYDCPVAHCPASNAKLGHGVAPVPELLAAGVRVGLGSDSVASNNRMDMLDEARVALLVQHARLHAQAALTPAAALELATLGGARALGMEQEIGSLAPGKQADLAAFALGDARTTPAASPEATLILALAGRPARFVAVAGRTLVDEWRVLGADDGARVRVEDDGRRLARWRDQALVLARDGGTALA